MKIQRETEAMAWTLFAQGCLQQATAGNMEPQERAEKVASMADAMLVEFRKRIESDEEREGRFRAAEADRRRRSDDEAAAARAKLENDAADRSPPVPLPPDATGSA